MDMNLLYEIIACLPKGRTLFRYFKDRYALMLLGWAIGDGLRVADLKNSRFQSLLNKPRVKAILARYGQGWIDADAFRQDWSDDARPFVLTLARWGGGRGRWMQTSRDGANLVLQLNFSNEHDSAYQKMVRPHYGALLNRFGHPVMRDGNRELFRETLAWARIDLDFEHNEALIEEIQSDWVREAEWLLKDARFCLRWDHAMSEWYNVAGQPQSVIEYVENVLAPYKALWAEAMLAVTIDFIHRELGINTIYYHSYDTGCRVKNIRNRKPPRSLYTTLPRRFCFETTDEAPSFLLADKGFRRKYRKVPSPAWQRLSMQEVRHARTA